jgi:hypothetical protein
MNWEAAGAIGEIIGSIAVLITLIYLATQIRQSNTALAESTSASINASYASINSRISSDEEFAELFVRGRHDLQSLSPVELERFRAFVQDILNVSVYVDGLQSTHGARTLHFDSFNVITGLHHTYPGIRDVVDSMEASTPRDLVARIRKARGTYTMIENSGPSPDSGERERKTE